MSTSEIPSASHESLALVVTEDWLDAICEQVGSLGAVLQALSQLAGHDRPHTLAGEALDNCAALHDLLNAIPVWGGRLPSHAGSVEETFAKQALRLSQQTAAAAEADLSPVGDSFPEFEPVEEDSLPIVDPAGLEARCGQDVDRMIDLLQRFHQRADGDVRQLELLSIGHDWTRLSRLAGALKDSAAHASATRIIVDAAALQGAARIGCRNDVDLALGALRSDLRACTRQVEEWQSAGVVD